MLPMYKFHSFYLYSCIRHFNWYIGSSEFTPIEDPHGHSHQVDPTGNCNYIYYICIRLCYCPPPPSCKVDVVMLLSMCAFFKIVRIGSRAFDWAVTLLMIVLGL